MIFFTSEDVQDEMSPFSGIDPRHRLACWKPERADVIFLAGMDWQSIAENQRPLFPLPVINLIQGVRHADPEKPLYQFLSHRAVRICVSPDVRSAIESTGRVNGPLFTIPNGLDLSDLPLAPPPDGRRHHLVLMGVKNRPLARHISQHLQLQGIDHLSITEKLPRREFLGTMAEARTVILLPLAQEGFYLPALEAMALGCTVICPDCVGNRSFCIDGRNSFRPAYDLNAIMQSINDSMTMDEQRRQAMEQAARQTAENHSLEEEKQAFLRILSNIDQLYRDIPFYSARNEGKAQ
ncbi:MAG: glycosyltransferase [Syntrophales bacterium]|nr:glycosyltransferase [Syntrophales bacterium]